MKDLNKLRDRAYKTACEHGFHEEELSDMHLLMLAITELSEAVEADRKGRQGEVVHYKNLSQESVERTGNSEYFNKVLFWRYIKDSVGDELADAAIRLLDLAGLRNIEVYQMQTMEESHDWLFSAATMPFTECIYVIVLNIIKYGHSTPYCINSTLASIFALAKSRDIDLIWHINEKMKYNELRPNKHGNYTDKLKEAANAFADEHGFRVPYNVSGREITNDDYYDKVDIKAAKDGFIAGAEWQKENMRIPVEEKLPDANKI